MKFNYKAEKLNQEHNKRIEEIDRKAGIGKYSVHNPTKGVKSKALKRKVGK